MSDEATKPRSHEEIERARHAVEALAPQHAFGLEIEAAEVGADNVRRIRGYANTFGVMRSGRIIHPQAVEDWLAANPQATLALLAQHGYVSDFATIGRVDTLKVQRTRGLYFEATLATGTALADQAWTLVSQKLLGSLSIGWIGRQARWVRADDVDLDPWLAKKMKEAGASECYAFLAVELLEISLVDIGDDRGAKLAARLSTEEIAAVAEAVARRVTPAAAPGAEASQAAVEASLKAVGKVIEEFATGLENRLVETIEAAVEARDAYRADCASLADGSAADAADVGAAPPAPEESAIAAALARVRGWQPGK